MKIRIETSFVKIDLWLNKTNIEDKVSVEVTYFSYIVDYSYHPQTMTYHPTCDAIVAFKKGKKYLTWFQVQYVE